MLRSIGVAAVVTMWAAQAQAGFLEYQPVSDPTFSGRVNKIACDTYDFLFLRDGVAQPGSGGVSELRPNSFVLDVPNSAFLFTHNVRGGEKAAWQPVSLIGQQYDNTSCSKQIVIKHGGATAVIDFCLDGREIAEGKSAFTLANVKGTWDQIYLGACRAVAP